METYIENLKREKRSAYMVQIRKENNDKLFALKRNNILSEPSNKKVLSNASEEIIDISAEISNFLCAFENKNLEKTMLHLFNCRRKIANSQNNNNYNDIEQIIEKGMLSKVVIILDGGFFDHPLLYQEASWCISNMAGGKHEHVEALVSAGVVGSMVRLFIAEQNYSIIDNSLYFFGNLTGDDLQYRSLFLSEEFLIKLLNIFEVYKKDDKLMKNYMWFLFLVSRGRPYPSFTFFKRIFHILKEMIFSQVNEIANYALTILIYASDGDELTQINYIINSGIIAPLLSFLKSNVDETLTMALRVFNNLSYGADTQTRILVDLHIVNYLTDILKNNSTSKNNKRIAAFTLSNIMCSEPYQLQTCLDNQNLINLLIEMIHQEPKEIVKECIICFTNSTFRGTYTQMCYLIQNGILNVFLETLSLPFGDFDLIDEILQAILNILNIGSANLVNGKNLFKEKLEQLGFSVILDHIQTSQNEKIRKGCFAILDQFFEGSSVFHLNQIN